MRPIYKASFSIGKEDKKPKLESVIETARFWASEKLPGNPLADFGKGISLEDSKGDLKTVFVDEGETRHFGMTFGHPDIVNPDFRWEVRFAAREEQNKPHTIGISLSNGWKGNLIMPAQTEITRPALVSRLVDQFHSYEGYYPLNITPVMIGSGKISALVANIFDKKRNLPIVCVSWKNLTDKPIANANKISSYLAGIAHTCIINRHATFELADQAGKSLSCFNGAVRIYWPVGNVNPASIMHPFWTPLEISAAGDKFPQKVLETIAKFSIGRSLPVSYEDVKMREALGKIKAGKDSAELEEVVRLYEEDKAALQIACEERDEQIRNLTIRVNSLEYALTSRKEGSNVEDTPFVEPKTILEAITRFRDLYSESQAVIINSKAEDMAKSCQYEDPVQVFRALEWLATRYHAAKTNKAKIPKLDESCMSETGMHYKSNQSPVTMGQFRDDYFIKVDGKNVPLTEHLRKGTSKDPAKTISIAFHYDEAKKKVIIGFIGQHQETRST